MNDTFIGRKRVSNTNPANGTIPAYNEKSGRYEPTVVSVPTTALTFDELILDSGHISAGCADMYEEETSAAWTEGSGSAGYTGRYLFGNILDYDDALWMIGGYISTGRTNTVYKSTNGGTTWTSVGTLPDAIFGHATVVYDGKMWLIAGNTGSGDKSYIYTSTNGSTWTQVAASSSFGPRLKHQVVVYDGKMWLSGGRTAGSSTGKRDVWYSTDGVTWTQATSSADWLGRCEHQMVVANDKLWVICGITGTSTRYKDVWYSTDGASWTQATADTGFTARSYHACAVINDVIYLTGGRDSTAALNDGYFSTDGVTWTALETSNWGIRVGHGMINNGGELWLFAGWNYSSTYYADAYYYNQTVYPFEFTPSKVQVHLVPYNTTGDYYSIPIYMRNQTRAAANPNDFLAEGSKIHFNNNGSKTNLTGKPKANDILIVEQLA
jgi:hypothetical protein